MSSFGPEFLEAYITSSLKTYEPISKDDNPAFLAISRKMTKMALFRKASATSISSPLDRDLPHLPHRSTASPVPTAVGLSNPQMSGQQRRMLDRINELHSTG